MELQNKPIKAPRYRAFCFTLNNYEDSDLLTELPDKFSMYCYAEEIAPTSGTPHLQGFLRCKTTVTVSALSKYFDKRAHVEPMRGTYKQNETYCSKSGRLVILGEIPMEKAVKGQLEKERWQTIMALVKAHDYTTLERDYPKEWLRYHKSWTNYRTPAPPRPSDPNTQLENYWAYGPTGTGKSSQIRLWCKDQGVAYYLKKQDKWWCGYNHEPMIIIEEVAPDWAGKSALKIWADHGEFPVHIKNGSMNVNPKHIYVTSNYTLDECFDGPDLEPMRRRFRQIPMKRPYDYANDVPQPFTPSHANMNDVLRDPDPVMTSSNLLEKIRRSRENSAKPSKTDRIRQHIDNVKYGKKAKLGK